MSRIATEAAVEHVDDRQERVERRIGRPRKVDRFRPLVEQLLQEADEDRAPLKSVEILRRARLDGYDGVKTALYELVAELRLRHTRVMMRFEGCRASSPSTTSVRCACGTWTAPMRRGW